MVIGANSNTRQSHYYHKILTNCVIQPTVAQVRGESFTTDQVRH